MSLAINRMPPEALAWTTEIEMGQPLSPHPPCTLAVFDFDGTLSWVRHGWPAIMIEVFDRHLPRAAGEGSADRLKAFEAIVFGLNGRPTIEQMARFVEVVRERGGPALEAETLRQEFQGELDRRIEKRLAQIRQSAVPPDAFVVFGARALLERLKSEGVTLAVLSSTIEHRVREEAEALGLTQYFGDRIYGSSADPAGFAKMKVFRRLLEETGTPGAALLCFGDGPVEIQCARELGGVAVAVCSDEEQNGSGWMDGLKRRQLLESGAHLAVPDFRDASTILEWISRP